MQYCIQRGGEGGEVLIDSYHFKTFMSFDQWSKSGIPSALVAEIGYFSISVAATTPGRHVFG